MVEAGGHGLLTFRRQDLIVVSPGVPLDTPELAQANFGLPVIGELELAARFLKGKILAITGSNGKTTTTSLLGEILEKAGFPRWSAATSACPSSRSSTKAPTTPGRSSKSPASSLNRPSSFIPTSPSSSTSLPTISTATAPSRTTRSPRSASSPRKTRNDFVVLNADNVRAAAAATRSKARVYWFSLEHTVAQGAWVEGGAIVFRSAAERRVRNHHASQRHPAQGRTQRRKRAGRRLRRAPRRRLGRSVRHAIEKFKAVEHRLEYVATLNGVEFYNDSKATNVDATAKAIAAFSSGIHLILGGKDKNSDYTQLSDLLRERVRAVYTIGSAAAKIESQLRGSCRHPLLRDARQGRQRRCRRRASRRSGAARPGLLQLRPVRKLRAPRPRLQGTRQRVARHGKSGGDARTQPIERRGTTVKMCEPPGLSS